MTNIDINRYDAVTAQHESAVVGSAYKFIPTTRVIDILGREGWAPSRVSEARTLKASRKGFQKHLVRFRRTDSGLLANDLVPEIVLTNAHDGAASFQLMAGIFRLVCSNGLVVADSMFATHRIKHVGFAENKVLAALQDVIETTPRVMSRVEDFKAIMLTPNEQGIFAESALLAKLGGDEERMPTGLLKDRTLRILLTPRRAADMAPTLWNTYNVVQEKILTGGRFLASRYGRAVKSREVKSVDKNIALNKALWALTERMAELKAGHG